MVNLQAIAIREVVLIVIVTVLLAIASNGAPITKAMVEEDGLLFPPQSDHVHGSSVLQLSNGNLLVVWFRANGERRDDDGQIEGSIYSLQTGNWSSLVVVGKIHGLPSTNPTVFVTGDGVLHLIWIAVQGNEWGGSILMHQFSTDYLHHHAGDIVWEGPYMISVKPANDYTEGNPTKYERDVYNGCQKLRLQPLPELGNLTYEQWQVPYCIEHNSNSPPVECLGWIGNWQAKIIGVHRNGTPIDISLPIEDAVDPEDIVEENSYLPGHAGERVRRSVGWMTRAHPLILPSGRILLGLYSDFQWISTVGISDDNGKTWRPSTTPIVSFLGVQPSIVQRKDGTLFAFMRDNGKVGFVQYATSSDDGETWSVAMSETQLKESGSGLEAINLRNGNWAVILNDVDSGRYRLSIYVSNNEGITWTREVIVIDDPVTSNSYSYPSMIEDSTIDNLLHVTHSYHHSSGASIYYRSIYLQ